MKYLSGLLVLPAVVLLASCGGGEPSESNIQDVLNVQVEQEFNQQKQLMKSLAGSNAANYLGDMPQIVAVEKTACAELSEQPGYRCDFKMTVSKGGQEATQPHSARFVKGKNGWEMFEN